MNTVTPDVYELDLVCRHCGQQLKRLEGVQADDLAVGRAQLRQVAQLHCNAVGRHITVTVRVTRLETVDFAPRSD
jgi:hypothetical protein